MTVTANTAQSPVLPNQRLFPSDPALLQRELNNAYVNIASSVNVRDIAVYSQSPTATGQRFDFIPDVRTQEAKRRVVLFGPIAPGATVSLPHNLTGFTTFTRIYGVATTRDAVTFVNQWLPLPYASATLITDQVSLTVDLLNVIIVNGATADPIISAIVVMEFI